MSKIYGVLFISTVLIGASGMALAQPARDAKKMSFFVTSEGAGKGADYGGLEGADAHCLKLAKAAGSDKQDWRAYLSLSPDGGKAGVNAKDRIGAGPWVNINGAVIAKSVGDLHSDANNLNKQTALTEKGDVVNGRGDQPNMHDVLTGSDPGGTFVADAAASTCKNWTSSTDGTAIVGHHDRIGLNDTPPAKSWNSSHRTRACGLEALKGTGGAGLLYCFAAK